MTRFKTIDQRKYWEVHDWERGCCVATAIPDQDMAEAMAEALNGSLTADRDRWKALAVEAGAALQVNQYHIQGKITIEDWTRTNEVISLILTQEAGE